MSLQNSGNSFTPFLPSTQNIPEEEDRRRVFLVDTFSNMADVINDKKIGMYIQDNETLNGNKIFYSDPSITRNGYQVVFFIDSLPNAGVVVIPMIDDVNEQLVVTHTWGSASRPPTSLGAGDGSYFSFMNEGDTRISYTVSDTLVTITTTTNLSAYSGFIFFEFLRNGT